MIVEILSDRSDYALGQDSSNITVQEFTYVIVIFDIQDMKETCSCSNFDRTFTPNETYATFNEIEYTLRAM